MDAASALVVGATSEIGRAIAVQLARSGHALTLWGRRPGALQETADACAAVGSAAVTDLVDVTDTTAMGAALERLSGRGPVRTVVWTPGVFDWGRADVADPEAWRSLLEVDLVAPAVFTALVAPLLVRSAPSTLVYLGSGAGHQAYADNAAYVAGKHGLTGLARSAFLDLRDRGVKVSLVSPGLVAAGGGLLSPAGRERPEELLSPADVASAVGYVVASPPNCCPTEIRLQPLHTP